MARGSKPIILVFPPSFAFDQPYLAIPALAAFLRQHGIPNLQHWDCNIDSFWYFLGQDCIESFAQTIRKTRTSLEARQSMLSIDEQTQYESLVEAELVTGPVLAELDAAKAYFLTRSESTSFNEYQYYFRVISKALKIISAAFYPTELSQQDFTMRFSPQSSEDIFSALKSPENPYIQYYTSSVVPRIRVTRPRLVGVSLACMSQIIPSFTLASLIRESLPDTKIVFGGQVFNRLVDRVKETHRLFDLVDFFVIHEGETALLSLCKYMDGQMPLESVPNLIYLDPERSTPIQTTEFHVEDVCSIPPPDFSDLDLSRYLSPRLVLPYQPVRGCYWHRCAFCNHHVIHPASARSKTPTELVTDLRYLAETHGTNLFTMVSESIEPTLLQAYARRIADDRLDIKWYAGARLEAALSRECIGTLKTSGCMKLYFGLESGSQKVLDEMQKGIRLSETERILRECAQLGIAVHLFLMIGYPTETAEDLKASKCEILRLAGIAPREGFTFYVSTFQLKPYTAIFNQPEEFGISLVSRIETEKDLEYLYEYRLARNARNVDYDMEMRSIEEALDAVQGAFLYPENIVHYLAMGDSMRSPMAQNDALPWRGSFTDVQYDANLMVRGGLGYCIAFSRNNCNSEHPKPLKQYLVYDLTTDQIFEINDPIAWGVLRKLSSSFSMNILRSTIGKAIAENGMSDPIRQERLVHDLLASKLIVPTEKGAFA